MTDHDVPAPDRRGSTADRDGMNQGLRVLSHLIAGVLLYGGLGWLGDHLLHTSFLLPIGIVGGAALGIYVTIRRITAEAATAPDQVVVGSGPRTRTGGEQ